MYILFCTRKSGWTSVVVAGWCIGTGADLRVFQGTMEPPELPRGFRNNLVFGTPWNPLGFGTLLYPLEFLYETIIITFLENFLT